jgi:hypothetical protein
MFSRSRDNETLYISRSGVCLPFFEFEDEFVLERVHLAGAPFERDDCTKCKELQDKSEMTQPTQMPFNLAPNPTIPSTTPITLAAWVADMPVLVDLFERAVTSGIIADIDTIISVWSRRVVRGEVDPEATLRATDRWNCPELRGTALYSVATNLSPITNPFGVTALPRPAALTDEAYLRLLVGYNSLRMLWERFRYTGLHFVGPVPPSLADQHTIVQWNARWVEFANWSNITTIGEADVLGRLRALGMKLEGEEWVDGHTAETLSMALSGVIDRLEGMVYQHFC